MKRVPVIHWRTEREPEPVTVRYNDGTEEVRDQAAFSVIPDNLDYKTYLLSHEWQERRQKVMRRDRWRCTWCGSRDGLEIHHLTYDHIGQEELGELTTLCSSCHKARHPKTRTAGPTPTE